MAKDNVIRNIGDVLIVNSNPQIIGKVTFTDYSDVLEGITANRNVSRQFRVSPDGIFWGEWDNLTSENISKISYNTENSLIIQVAYTRIGSDASGEIEFKSIDFIGKWENIEYVAPTIDSSIFADIIGTPELKILEENIFKKLYYRGILPQYITRAENSDEREDKDFIDMFYSVARFFSLLILFFKRFENFRDDFFLMREQVRQYGIYFDEQNITLEELQFLAQHLFDQIRQRGTVMIFKRKGDVLPDGSVVPIDGEFIRLMRSKISDELLYENIPLEKVGWCLNQCSPMYRGTARSKYLNKTKEDTEDFQDINNFITSSQGSASVALQTYDNKRVLALDANLGGICGLGRIDESKNVSNNLYVADSQLDYEITFAFKVIDGGKWPMNVLKFGVEGFDSMKNKLQDSFITPNGELVTDWFLEGLELSNINPSAWYHVRGIIHAYSSINIDDDKLNIGFGNNLYFNNRFVRYILPKIQIQCGNPSLKVAIWDYKIRPLVRGRNILPLKNGQENSTSLGFIQSSRIFYAYVRNNNNNQSQSEVTDIIEKYLLPYNLTDIFVFMSNY